ncbi:unnamed protein product [Phytomonas sp. EM1]|nr:unnamed protein product [Phytomonas sp. EM1]|eukprot:CCW60576.1 unnamed protein product [Phytomonas sp. isolate EM1]
MHLQRKKRKVESAERAFFTVSALIIERPLQNSNDYKREGACRINKFLSWTDYYWAPSAFKA